MRLSDAGLRRRQRKLIYPDHRLPPWLTEDATPRSLEPLVRHSGSVAVYGVCDGTSPYRLGFESPGMVRKYNSIIRRTKNATLAKSPRIDVANESDALLNSISNTTTKATSMRIAAPHQNERSPSCSLRVLTAVWGNTRSRFHTS